MQEFKYNEIKIDQFLKNIEKEKIIYIPNPGNVGDVLITLSTINLFNELGLNFEIGDINKKYDNKFIIYGGGGNLIGIYKNCRNFLILNKDNNKIIVLPHTIKNEDELIKSFDDKIIIFCREKVSYNYVYGLMKNKENCYLSDDMAFYFKPNFQLLSRYEKNVKGNKRNILNCFRRDVEKTNIFIPQDNIDLSIKYCHRDQTTNYPIMIQQTYRLLKFMKKYEIIKTNRLHIAIIGSLIGKKVFFYPNNYYKNKAVYEYSMKNKFSETIFIEKNE